MTERNKKSNGKKGGKRTAAPTPKPNTRKDPAGSQKAGRSNASGRRRYSDEEKGTALALYDANGGNLLRTAEELGIPRKTLEGWVKDRNNEAVAEIRHSKKAELAALWESVAINSVKLLSQKLNELPVGQLPTTSGIATDKWLLLNDMPTGIQKVTGFEDLSDDDLDKFLAED